MSRDFSPEELVVRIWDKENVLKTINRHSYYYSNEQRREELDALWVQDPENQKTASLSYNNGFYTGMDEIARHYVDYRAKQREDAQNLYRAAGVPGDIGLGCAAMHTSTTPLVYIADDGKTAQYLGYHLGFESTGKPDGSAATYMDLGLIHADLIKEDGQWKIWHLSLEHDHTITVGENYAKVPVRQPPEEDPLFANFGTPTIQREVYNPFFGWENMWYDMPRPYAAMTPERSYGPDGNLGKMYYERDKR